VSADCTFHYYGESENDKIIVLVPGYTQNHRAFNGESRWVDVFAAEGFATVSVEFHARPDNDLLDYTRALSSRVLMLKQKYRSVGIVGHSMGGLIAGAMDAEANAACDALCTLGAPLLPGVSFGALTPIVGGGIKRFCRYLVSKNIGFDGVAMAQWMKRFQGALDTKLTAAMPFRIWEPGEVDESVLEHALETSFRMDSFQVFSDFVDLRQSGGERAGRLPMGERLRAMTAPLLVIAADHDGLADKESTRIFYERAASIEKRYKMYGQKTFGGSIGHVDMLIGAHVEQFILPEVLRFMRLQMQA